MLNLLLDQIHTPPEHTGQNMWRESNGDELKKQKKLQTFSDPLFQLWKKWWWKGGSSHGANTQTW